MTEASIHQTKLNDITNFGLRAKIGVIFIALGSGKFNPKFAGFLTGPQDFRWICKFPLHR